MEGTDLELSDLDSSLSPPDTDPPFKPVPAREPATPSARDGVPGSPNGSPAAVKSLSPQPPDVPTRSVLAGALQAAYTELDSKLRRLMNRIARLRNLPEPLSPGGKRLREDEMTRLVSLREKITDTMKSIGECHDLESVDYVVSENGR